VTGLILRTSSNGLEMSEGGWLICQGVVLFHICVVGEIGD
jgi:hypothetical protein